MGNITIIKGLNVSYPSGGVGVGTQILIINPGYISFNSVGIQNNVWSLNSIYKIDQQYSLKLQSNGGNAEKIFGLFALPNYSLNYGNNSYGLNFKIKQIDIQNYSEDTEDAIFISFVILPPMFPTLNTKSYFNSINKNLEDTSFSISWDTFYKEILKKINVWESDNFYFIGQTLRVVDALYYCIINHISSNVFDDDKDLFWTQLSSSASYEDVIETIDGNQYSVTYVTLSDGRKLILATKQI